MAQSAVDRLKELLGLIKDTAVDLKTDFQEESKFQQMRILTALVFLVDVVATLVVVFVLAGGGAEYEAWLESSGPSNLLMIRRSTDDLERGVEVLLDGTYKATVDLKGKSAGFAMDAVFEDPNGRPPSRDYKPRRIELVVDGDRVSVPLGAKR